MLARMLDYLRKAMSLGTREAMAHSDQADRRLRRIERDVQSIKGRIDPLAELVESLRGNGDRDAYR